MTRMTGGSASVERKIGRAISCPNGDNERPYGRCYGQVCGVAYPCTQKPVETDAASIPSREEYGRRKRCTGGGIMVTCVETGEEWPSMKAAAKSIGIGEKAFRHAQRKRGGEIHGLHYKVAL